MAVPTYDKFMLPLLQFVGEDGQEHDIHDAMEAMVQFFQLSQEDVEQLLPSGKQTVFYNRVGWAKTYLTKSGLLESTGRGKFQITERGYQVLEQKPSHIDKTYLNQFDEFQEFQQRTNAPSETAISNNSESDEDEQTPEELIETTYRKLRKSLSDELLETVLAVSPRFFERLVVDLLLAMGYGSSLDSGEHLGQSNDGGVDGVIREDKLGLDAIYLQAKRYSRDNGVGRPAIQGFVGSLMGVGATKGVFITTSHFSKQAIEYAENVPNLKVILIDGQQLATLMIEHNVGISVQKTYEIKQIDENYFPDS